MNSAWKVFEINDVDISYKAIIKSPVRLTQVRVIASSMKLDYILWIRRCWNYAKFSKKK